MWYLASFAAGVAAAGGAWFWAAKRRGAQLKAAVDEAHNLSIGHEFRQVLFRVGIRLK